MTTRDTQPVAEARSTKARSTPHESFEDVQDRFWDSGCRARARRSVPRAAVLVCVLEAVEVAALRCGHRRRAQGQRGDHEPAPLHQQYRRFRRNSYR